MPKSELRVELVIALSSKGRLTIYRVVVSPTERRRVHFLGYSDGVLFVKGQELEELVHGAE